MIDLLQTRRVATALFLIAPLFAPAAASDALAQAAGGEPPPQAVTVMTLKAQEVTLTARLPGRVVASGVAEVRPQVNGVIQERLFDEGAAVDVGDPLYKIDAATYEARVAAAQAQVAEAAARYTASRKDAERAADLVQRKVGTQQALDAAISQRDVDAATLQVARAELNTAEIDLARTTIRAQLRGVVGRSLTTQGALVTSGQADPLAIIRALDPVYVDVTQSAAEILAWRRGDTLDKIQGADTSVSLLLADGGAYPQRGEVTAAEPYVNETTGVVTLRMTFDNPNQTLLPGMYVQVDMPQGVVQNAILAPQQGVMRDRRGNPIAYVVNADNVVEERSLTVLQARGNTWIVSEGLQDGDRIVIEGFQKTGPGATVTPEEGLPVGAAPETN
ncbi:efflux RND transporter periplasmic adaptor subunit [Rhodospirillaceae bacterium KN72]|uniref:Efflux RND transporter periplasmic adaptor subunit n=1 Tax=Pacificispira spongiicola TaxID=2729598 RepID=A0A7Y0DXI6_9PROT|nr:efflux RND transporter periplasmic adaptor subunit [Pacificispira spongiicola]NMM43278.1 efflux RND transporter periplasmic adaptor subunit [Pacificispira spongiicola]